MLSAGRNNLPFAFRGRSSNSPYFSRVHGAVTSSVPSKTVAAKALREKSLLSRWYCSKKQLKEGHEVRATGGVYQLDHLRDPMADRLRKARSIRGRRETSEFLIEERSFIMQALMAEVPLSAVFLSQSAYDQQQEIETAPEQFGLHPTIGSLPLEDFGQGKTPIYVVADTFMSKLYPVDTPHMLALAPLLHSRYQTLNAFKKMKRILVLDNVLNPRNIGMILRNAEAFDVNGVLLLTAPNATDIGNTQDILYSRLSISASRGAAFRVPFLHVKKDDFLSFASQGHYDLICTSPHTDDTSVPEWEPPTKKSSKLKSKSKKDKTKKSSEDADNKAPSYSGQMIVIGNESEGVRPEILKHATSLLTIPTAVESLNAAVACGIVLFKLANQDIAIREGAAQEFVSNQQKPQESHVEDEVD